MKIIYYLFGISAFLLIFQHAAFAQKKVKFQNITLNITEDWEQKDKMDENRLYIACKTASCILDIKKITAATSDEAAQKTAEIMKANNLNPNDFMKSEPKFFKDNQNAKIVYFESDQAITDNQDVRQWVNIYLMEVNDQKYVIYATEYYNKENRKKKDIEAIIQSIKPN